MLLLADEAPTPELRAEAWIDAAGMLRAAGHHDFALELLDRALALDAGNAKGLAELALARQRAALPALGDGQPRQVLLFSGHMVDAADRPTPRFPNAMVPLATHRIAAALAALDAGSEDLALTQGACGGDLLFTEACWRRGVPVAWLQPFAEPEFIAASVAVGGDDWQRRYLEAKGALAMPPRAAPEALGPPPADRGDDYAYERCNLWLLYTALAYGADKLRLIALWNGGGGDGPGGTAHLVGEARRRGGHVDWIDTRTL